LLPSVIPQAEVADHSLLLSLASRCSDIDRRLLRSEESASAGKSKAAAAAAARLRAANQLGPASELERRWLHLHQLRLAATSSPLLPWMQALSSRLMLLHLRIGFECELYHVDELGAVYWQIDHLINVSYRAQQKVISSAALLRAAPELREVSAQGRRFILVLYTRVNVSERIGVFAHFFCQSHNLPIYVPMLLPDH
jgi:hypothetical protein